MRVIVINEESHGYIGVALNYYNAVKWLIEKGWIDEGIEVIIGNDERTYDWRPITEVYGENWADAMLNEWDIDTFNKNMEGGYHLEVWPLIGGEWLFESGEG